MLDCDGWECATAYHDAFTSTVLGHPVAAVATNFAGVVNVTFQPSGWPEAVVREALAVSPARRERFAACLLMTGRVAAGADA